MPTPDGHPVALITGITGQDGSYLTEFLLQKGYHVHGIVRRASSFNTGRIDHLYQDPHVSGKRMQLHYGDLTDATRLGELIERIQPDELYNLAAQSHVKVSFDMPLYTADVVAVGALRLLEAVRDAQHRIGRKIKFYQASSSEMYGMVQETPQTEKTPFYPRSPYACAKLYAHWQTINYREAYELFACCGILFNHESPRRGETFVTRKITRTATRIKLGLVDKLYLGNIDARRDWGFAGDYVEAMWLMLQQEQPDDFVIATNETHSVREFLEEVFGYLGMNWQDHVAIDPAYYRPAEVDLLMGDPTKAERLLGWKPKITFRDLARLMTDADMKLAEQELKLRHPTV